MALEGLLYRSSHLAFTLMLLLQLLRRVFTEYASFNESPPETVSRPSQEAGCPQSSSKSSRISSEIREYVSRRRYWLSVGAVLLVLVICLGIVFAAHHYYISFGGQGFLKARVQYETSQLDVVDAAKVHLPFRKVAGTDKYNSSGWARRSPMEVPYYACGDQQASCEAYNQPVRP